MFLQESEVIAQETEGILICGGDLNTILDQNMDKTGSKKSSKIHVTRYINTVLTEKEISDV